MWPQLSQSGRRNFLRKLKESARHLAASSLKGVIRLDSGSNNVAPRILIERTPADLDTRGMPQGWQSQARRMATDLGRGGGLRVGLVGFAEVEVVQGQLPIFFWGRTPCRE